MVLFIVILALMSAAGADAASNPLQAISTLVSKITDESLNSIADIKQPIVESGVFIGTSQCSNVKRLIGVVYETTGTEIEPDLNDLTLVFRNSEMTVTYNLSQASDLITKTGFNASQNLYIFIHGFTSSPNADSFTDISDALFSIGKFNVLALDASLLINWFYLRATVYTTFIGAKLGDVLTEMVKYGLDPSQIHIIGHSLGAHISAFAGKQVFNKTGSRVGRITGLDPAGPCFADVGVANRLTKADADFVEVIHTNARALGLDDTMGHADYWPNGGSEQEDCLYQSCSHGRSWMYFAESVNNTEAFPAIKCDSWKAFKNGDCSNEISYMGFASNSSASGNYYLRTAGSSPYGLGVNGSVYDDSNESIVQKIADLVS